MGDNGRVAGVLAANEGVITTAQALACGLTRRQIHQRVASGEWKTVSLGVLRSAAHEYTESAMVRAAVAALRGVADRTTGGWWQGVWAEGPADLPGAVGPPPPPARWSGGRVNPVRRRYHASDVTELRGLRVTGLPMTVLTAAAELADGATLIDRALQAFPVTVAELDAALERNAGLRGFAGARRLLAVARGDTESAAERLFVALLRAERITGWTAQYPFAGWRIDFAWPTERVAVEIDGWAFHHRPDQFDRDHRKRNALVQAHWLVLAYTWHQLTGDPATCAFEVTGALAERRAELG